MTMTTITLDDTFLAVVQLSHEHGLPLTAADVNPGYVTVRCESVDARWWVRWLADPAVTGFRCVVWDVEDARGAAFQVYGTRESVEWAVVERVPVDIAVPILTAHGHTLSTEHQRLSAVVAVALADALAGEPATGESVPCGTAGVCGG